VPIKEGIYDQLVTGRVQKTLRDLDGDRLLTTLEDLDEGAYPDYLARHLIREIEIANQLLSFLNKQCDDSGEIDAVSAPAQLLKAVYRPPSPPRGPEFPLGKTGLIMNADGEPKLGSELERELATSDSVLMLVSFIQWRGWQRLRPAFQELAQTGRPVRILTTTYIGASDLTALDALVNMPNVELKISLDGRRRRLHAKAWMFERLNGFSSVYVGSANVSGPALEDGIEWTVKLSEVEAPAIMEKFRGAFESLWLDPEFERFNRGDDEFRSRVKAALTMAGNGPGFREANPVYFDLKPHPYQQATLDQLEAERLDRGETRNLVVAPTGTGKTLIAAFDYARQIPKSGVRPRLLFIAHREELIRQARDRFRHVLRDNSFGEILGGGVKPDSYDYLFSTVQSFQSRRVIEATGHDHWDYVVFDEAHHCVAQSYRDVIDRLRPRILLGLTATPERMDGESILPWFGNRIADEMRLWHAVEQQYLVPFDYYGIHDGTDLSTVSWTRGSYAVADLDRLYSGDKRRADLVVDQFREIYGNFSNARALGFCVSVRHAEFMAEAFNRAGIPAAAVTSQSGDELRLTAIGILKHREVNVLFTVDLFNEGIDIPEADCLLFLRPTESSTVFVQQLGRGLRHDFGKQFCLVLDFIGNQRREFRFDLRLRALFGGTRQQVTRQPETNITALPGNCYFRLDKQSRKAILENLKYQLSANRTRMVQEVRALSQSLQRRPRLAEFLNETQYDLSDVYKNQGCWTYLLIAAGQLELNDVAVAIELTQKFGHILHIDSVRRLNFYREVVGTAGEAGGEQSIAGTRQLLMLTFRLLQGRAREAGQVDAAVRQLQVSPEAQLEFMELTDVLLDRIRIHVDEKPYQKDWPLYLHRQYTRDEILIAVGFQTLESKAASREGRLWLAESKTELLFVTLDKSDKQFSATTRYEDFAISPTRFHWQSQSTTSDDSATGRRYIEQGQNGSAFLLFVRRDRHSAYTFLGPLQFVSYLGSRPMSIHWDLLHPMPAAFFETCASLRAA
jgi:superfamily II DNA or RNA helicase/HKD family nuclease